jgi:hypothetical protein
MTNANQGIVIGDAVRVAGRAGEARSPVSMVRDRVTLLLARRRVSGVLMGRLSDCTYARRIYSNGAADLGDNDDDMDMISMGAAYPLGIINYIDRGYNWITVCTVCGTWRRLPQSVSDQAINKLMSDLVSDFVVCCKRKLAPPVIYYCNRPINGNGNGKTLSFPSLGRYIWAYGSRDNFNDMLGSGYVSCSVLPQGAPWYDMTRGYTQCKTDMLIDYLGIEIESWSDRGNNGLPICL